MTFKYNHMRRKNALKKILRPRYALEGTVRCAPARWLYLSIMHGFVMMCVMNRTSPEPVSASPMATGFPTRFHESQVERYNALLCETCPQLSVSRSPKYPHFENTNTR